MERSEVALFILALELVLSSVAGAQVADDRYRFAGESEERMTLLSVHTMDGVRGLVHSFLAGLETH